MKKWRLSVLICCWGIVSSMVCLPAQGQAKKLTPEEAANRLYVEAVQLVKAANKISKECKILTNKAISQIDEESFKESLELGYKAIGLHQKALAKAEKIISDYPSSRMAVELIQEKGIIPFAGNNLSITEFKKKIERVLNVEILRYKSHFEKKLKIKKIARKIATEIDCQLSIFDHDGRFIKCSNGVVYDADTDLEWVSGPDRDKNWNQAVSWVENLFLDGHGWRMPTIAELRSLYRRGAGNRNMILLLKTTGWYIWSGEISDSSSARFFGFYGDGNGDWGIRRRSGRGSSHYHRVFAVRSRKR